MWYCAIARNSKHSESRSDGLDYEEQIPVALDNEQPSTEPGGSKTFQIVIQLAKHGVRECIFEEYCAIV